jgi:mono/diheme cytochrome c family protein
MLKRVLVAAMAATLAASVGNAYQSTTKVTIPLTRTDPTKGKQMYVEFCASCHGMNGRGHGPVSNTLKTPPVDLTVLSRNQHGTADMPVWGPTLGKISLPNSEERMLRISNLSRYLKSLQAK